MIAVDSGGRRSRPGSSRRVFTQSTVRLLARLHDFEAVVADAHVSFVSQLDPRNNF